MSLRDDAGAGVAALVAAALLCACGSGAGSSSAPTASGPTVTTRSTATSASTSASTSTGARQTGPVPARGAPPIGVTQHTSSRGAHLDVTVVHLIDPLRNSGAALLGGTRAIAVLVRIANNGPAIYDSSATGDFSVVSSGGVVTPVFVPNGICQTPLRDFDNYIVGGDIRTGCVAFAVGARERVLSVRFSPHAAAAGRLTWRVGR